MDFEQLKKGLADLDKMWENDDYMGGTSEEFRHKSILAVVQAVIGSNLFVMTKEELQKKLEDFHSSMEGSYFD